MNEELHNPHLAGNSFLWEAGPVGVLLSHGLTATTAEVRLLAERLYAAGYTVSGPLLAGHGVSPDACNESRWQDWLWTVESDFHRLATLTDRVFVGGESTGALLALYLASKHPEIAGVLTYAPAMRLAFDTTDVLRLRALAPFIAAVPKAQLTPGGHWQGYKVNPLRAVRELLRLQSVVEEQLALVQQPLLVVQGRLDETIDPASGEMIIAGVASEYTELHWMEASSHVVLVDQEIDAVAALTLAFMERVLSAERRDRR